MKSTLLGAICLSLAAAIWGGMYVVSKYVLDYVPPLTLVWFRYIVAFAVLYAALKWTRRGKEKLKLSKQDWKLFVWIGFIGYFASISFQFMGTKLSDAHTGALVTSATPAFIVIFARLVLKERITWAKLVALLLSSVGVTFIIGYDGTHGDYFWGVLFLIGAALTWALLSVYAKVASVRHDTLTLTTYAVFFALLFTTPVMAWEIQTAQIQLNTSVIFGILYLGVISTAGAFFLWNKGMELMDASVGALFFFLQPVVGTFFGWLLLGEQLELNFLVGAVFILLGVSITTFHKESLTDAKPLVQKS
ncbi:DMT family transporter [Ammoniphilus sp. CFH 90114]|uniref:DMT family transporter n=1 Tax=Ammoniphilus sp. CFH 90114 TaxID=2493665 RepID=UPI00100DE88D|nr:EamA family transporter [Ammoniphilus sp. CFH 90114]RXT03723.1 EamA family transporter [Ammoniphilus sp. CFH 90114]